MKEINNISNKFTRLYLATVGAIIINILPNMPVLATNEIVLTSQTEGSAGLLCDNKTKKGEPNERVFVSNRHVTWKGMEYTTTENGRIKEGDNILYSTIVHSNKGDLSLLGVSQDAIDKCLVSKNLPNISDFLKNKTVEYTLETRRDESFIRGKEIEEDYILKGYNINTLEIPVTISNIIIISPEKNFYFLGTSDKRFEGVNLIKGVSGSTGNLDLPGNHYAIARIFGTDNKYVKTKSHLVKGLEYLPKNTDVYVFSKDGQGQNVFEIGKNEGFNIEEGTARGYVPLAKEFLEK
jgi:hypothetical protein